MNPLRILIVEDEVVVSMEISRRLQVLGYEPAGQAVTGEQALAMTEVQRPDLILMDIRLIGEMDGIQTAIEILRRFRIPVIFLSAYSEDETLDRAKLAEPYGYLTKPLEDRDLRSTIEMALHKHKIEEEVRRLSRLYDVLSQVNQTIVRVETPEELFQAVCRLLIDRGEIDMAWVSRLEPGLSRMDIVAHYGEQSEFLKEVRFHEEHAGWDTVHDLIREGRPFVCNEPRTGECMVPLEMPQGGLRIESFGAFPFTFQRVVWGSLNVCVSKPGFFQDREIKLFEEVAMDVSFALDRIESETRRKYAEETALRQNRVLAGINKIFRETLSSSTEEALGQACLSVAEEVTDSRFGFLSKTNTEGQLSDIAVSIAGKEACLVSNPTGHNCLPATLEPRGIYGRVVKHGKAFFTNDPGSHPDSIGLPSGHPPLEAFLGAPLKQDAETLGMIALGNRKDGYSSKDLEALEALTPAVVEALGKKRSETALAQSRAEFRAILNSISDAIIFTNTNREVLMVNPAFTAMFGYEAEEVRGRTTEFLYVNSSAYEEVGRKHYLVGEVTDKSPFEATYLRKDGSLLPAESLGALVKDAQGRVMGLLGVHRDITERKLAEENLMMSERRFRSILDQAADIILLHDLNGRLVDANQQACKSLGYSKEELLTMNISDIDPEAIASGKARLWESIAEGKRITFESSQVPKDGSTFPVEVTIGPIEVEQETLVLGIIRDITERKRAEMDLERMRNILSEGERIAHMGTFEYVVDAQTTVWSEEEFRIYGLDPSGPSPAYDVMLTECIHPDDVVLLDQTFMTAMQNNSIYELEHRIVRPDGSVRWVYDHAHPYFDENGRLLRYIGSTLDITERRQTQEALRESEEKYRKLMEDASDAIFLADAETGILLGANRQATVLTGWSQDELKGMHQRELHPAEDRGTYSGTFREHLATPGRTKEALVRHKDGGHIPVEITASPFTLNGRPVLQGIFRDVAERKKAEQEKARLESQLRHTQKLEAIGNLAGGIAHDFNNILSPIIGYTEMAMDGIEESNPSRYDLDQVLMAANRAKDLVKQILSFSRLGEEQLMRPIDVSLIVKEALKLLRASLPSTIEIRQDIHKVTILADATQIHQVIVNLCTNAAHAMQDAGMLEVSLQEVVLSDRDLIDRSIADLRPGKHLKLSIKDTGCGIGPDAMQRIFDPYFTTKEVGKGTGLGLSVVHGIVKRHAGEILVRSEVGKGSVFDVFIPVSESKLKHEGSTSQALPKGSERILFVDDEPAIVAMGARMLEQLGYKVTVKSNPKEALDLFRSQPDQFDLIITDYTMPKMVGTDLAKECMRIRAEIPVIVCSGHSERLNREEAGVEGVKAVAMKPLDRKQLAMLVRDVLDKATG